VPLVLLFGAQALLFLGGMLPQNDINGALMLFPRHRWGIDVVTRGSGRVIGGAAGTDGVAGIRMTVTSAMKTRMTITPPPNIVSSPAG
jgi:hypothetical protein